MKPLAINPTAAAEFAEFQRIAALLPAVEPLVDLSLASTSDLAAALLERFEKTNGVEFVSQLTLIELVRHALKGVGWRVNHEDRRAQ